MRTIFSAWREMASFDESATTSVSAGTKPFFDTLKRFLRLGRESSVALPFLSVVAEISFAEPERTETVAQEMLDIVDSSRTVTM